MNSRTSACSRANLAFLAAIIAGVSLSACTKSGDSKDGDKKGRRGGRGEGEAVPVRVEQASIKTLPRVVSVVASLVGRRQADVFSKVTGRLSFIGPKEGEPVKANTVLFRVDRSDPGESFLSTPVLSPISGWVGRWMITNLGEQVTPQDPVVTIVDDEALRASVYLSTSEWLVVDASAKVRVEINGEKRDGKVVSIARAADVNSGRGSALVEIDNSDHRWRAGMVARVEIEIEPKPRMIIPTTAMNITDQGTYVYAVQEGKAKRQVIRYHLIDSDRAEVLEGIADGSQIVVAGGNNVTNDVTVKIVDASQETKKSDTKAQ